MSSDMLTLHHRNGIIEEKDGVTLRKGVTMSALSNYLREHMRQRGWTQTDLAAESGIPKATISRIINDQVDEPGLSTFVKLSETLGVSLRSILEVAGFSVENGHQSVPQQHRLGLLVEAMPWLAPIVDEIAAMPPDDRESVLTYLEVLRRRRAE